MSNPIPVTYFEIIAENATSVAQFYNSVLGWEMPAQAGPYISVSTGEKGIHGAIVDTSIAIFPPGLNLTLAVRDCNEVLDKVIQSGGKLILPRTEVPSVGIFAMFEDPAGNRIGLTER
jgi:predicted enzyme related to lactoylglutathione lyase